MHGCCKGACAYYGYVDHSFFLNVWYEIRILDSSWNKAWKIFRQILTVFQKDHQEVWKVSATPRMPLLRFLSGKSFRLDL